MVLHKNDEEFARLSKESAKYLKAGKLKEYVLLLDEMALLLRFEALYADELKVLMLKFYLLLNCFDVARGIDSKLVEEIRAAIDSSKLQKHEVDELYLETIMQDSAPRRIMTVRDSLYVLELYTEGRMKEAESIVSDFQTGVSGL